MPTICRSRLVIAVVSRDILIIGAFILSWILSRPVNVHPLLVSKANTVAQLVLASLVLAELGLGLGLKPFVAICIWVTGALTILSAIVYFWVWLKHMASYEPSACADTGAQGPAGADQERSGFAVQNLVS